MNWLRRKIAQFFINNLDLRRHYTPFGNLILVDEDSIGYSSWDCLDSPSGKCQYAILEDDACDECLYCGDPAERL